MKRWTIPSAMLLLCLLFLLPDQGKLVLLIILEFRFLIISISSVLRFFGSSWSYANNDSWILKAYFHHKLLSSFSPLFTPYEVVDQPFYLLLNVFKKLKWIKFFGDLICCCPGRKLHANADASSDEVVDPPKVEEKIGAIPHGLSTDSDVAKRFVKSS